MTLLTSNLGFAGIEPSGGLAVKTCGIRQVDHALVAAAAGATVVGLVFAPSRRSVTVDLGYAVRQALNSLERRPLLVGVFVNEMPQTILDIAATVGLDVIQLSGDELPVEVAECAANYPVLKALRFPTGTPVEAALGDFRRYRALSPPDRLRFLVDTFQEGEYGGTGRLADWGIASELARHEDILLAGGLTPHNVAQAVSAVAPWGVDVSSGIEREGVKDPSLISTFITNARQTIANTQVAGNRQLTTERT